MTNMEDETTPEPQKNLGGRPKGVKNSKRELKDEIAKILEKNLKVVTAALESGELSAKEAAALYKDLLPYGAAKKVDTGNEIPEHLKYVKVIVKGYKPDENPFEDNTDDDDGTDDED